MNGVTPFRLNFWKCKQTSTDAYPWRGWHTQRTQFFCQHFLRKSRQTCIERTLVLKLSNWRQNSEMPFPKEAKIAMCSGVCNFPTYPSPSTQIPKQTQDTVIWSCQTRTEAPSKTYLNIPKRKSWSLIFNLPSIVRRSKACNSKKTNRRKLQCTPWPVSIPVNSQILLPLLELFVACRNFLMW